MGRGGFRRVDGNCRDLRCREESRGVEGGHRHWGHGGDASCSRLTSRRGREEVSRGWELGTFEDGAVLARGAPGLPTLLSDGAESRGVGVAILINGNLRKLLGEGDHGSERFRERWTSQEDVPDSLEESQLVDVGKSGEEECQARGGRGGDELD